MATLSPGFCEVIFDDLIFLEKCGGGTFGSVYRSIWKPFEMEVAVKKVLALDKEAQVLSVLSHRNIIKFYGAVIEEPNYCLVTEYASNGSLYNHLQSPNAHLDFGQILKWAKEIALGVNYLHREAPIKVIHRDLKSRNVVISDQWVCKICDFGASKFVGGTTKMSLAGTFPWMAPEVIQSQPVSDTCDAWSYGVVLWELLTHEVPFKGIEGFQVAWLVVERGERLPIPSICPSCFSKIMTQCWELDPKMRPSFRQILTKLDIILEDESVQDVTNLFLEQKNVWQAEIQQSLDRIKKAEGEINYKERQLKEREIQLMARERDLEQHLYVASLNSHDVNTWSELDVQQWIKQLSGVANNADLMNYADLFLEHHVTGKVLLHLKQEDLISLGIQSLGHRHELTTEIELLKAHNYRLLNFPPLVQVNKSDALEEQKLRMLKVMLIFGHHLQIGNSDNEHKWKMYMETDDEDDGGEFFSVLTCIKDVTFTCGQHGSFKLMKPPYIMEKWCVGIQENEEVKCLVNFENKVKMQRSFKYTHKLTTNSGQSIQKVVTLTLENVTDSNPGVSTLTCVKADIRPSQSSPQLQGVWVEKSCFTSLRTPEKKGMPDVWASIVAGRCPSTFDFPKPKHVPGTTMTLFAPPPSYNPWQSIPSSPGNLLMKSQTLPFLGVKNVCSSPGQVSPGQMCTWQDSDQAKKGQSIGHSCASQEYLSSGQVSSSNESLLVSMIGGENVNNNRVMRESQNSKVTFSLSDSSLSGSSTRSTESGFSEHLAKPIDTYASVCSKCHSAFDKSKDSPENRICQSVRQLERQYNNQERADFQRQQHKSNSNLDNQAMRAAKERRHYHDEHFIDHNNRQQKFYNLDKHCIPASYGANLWHNSGRGQSHFQRRGRRSQHHENQNKYGYRDNEKMHGSAPLVTREKTSPVRRAVSSNEESSTNNCPNFSRVEITHNAKKKDF